MNFSQALTYVRAGKNVRRTGWNGKGDFIALQKPDEKSKMTQAYIYHDTTSLRAIGKTPAKGLVPWAPTQADILAEDWVIAE